MFKVSKLSEVSKIAKIAPSASIAYQFLVFFLYRIQPSLFTCNHSCCFSKANASVYLLSSSSQIALALIAQSGEDTEGDKHGDDDDRDNYDNYNNTEDVQRW